MFKVRDAMKEDCPPIETMIKELIVYEGMPNPPQIDRQILERDGFGEHRLLRMFVAEEEDNKQLFGYALYFFKYSTYTGKSLYLEDLYVKPDYRHSGAGRALLTAVTKEAEQNSCNSVEWSCLQWNHKSIDFYKRFGAKEQPESEGWVSFKLDKQSIESIVNGSEESNL